MGMAVDKTGHGYHAGAVDDGGGLVLGGILGDGDDLAAINADMSAEEYIHPLIHSHNGNVGN